MRVIFVNIFYKNNQRKNRMFTMEEDYVWFMKKYGFDPEKDKRVTKKRDGTSLEYFIPNGKMYGQEDDDKYLEIEEILVDKNWMI